jgi:DNA-binding LytR/AlgR family response regulator
LIKCIIVEDEILAQQVIQNHLEKTPQLELVAICQNADEAKKVLDNNEVDLIFLDLQLPGATGLHFLRSIPDPPFVIITTAYAEYALESYEFNVIDYLLKPISFERFTKAINKLMGGRMLSQPTPDKENWGDHSFIKSGSKFFKVNFSEIIYVQAMKDYVRIFTQDFQLISHQTMNELEAMLPGKQFIRIHKSYIVSINHIKIIYGNSVEIDSITLPIGNNYKESVMSMIGRKT